MKVKCNTCFYEWEYSGNQTDLKKVQCPHKHTSKEENCKYIPECKLFEKDKSYRCGSRDPKALETQTKIETDQDIASRVLNREKEKVKKKSIKNDESEIRKWYMLRKIIQDQVVVRFLAAGNKGAELTDDQLQTLAKYYNDFLGAEMGILPPVWLILPVIESSYLLEAKKLGDIERKRKKEEKKIKDE